MSNPDQLRTEATAPFTSAKSVVLAGGGTAGHVMPALAIAEALVEGHRPSNRIRFIGSSAGMEARLVPAAGYRFDGLPLRNFSRQRSLTWVVSNLRSIFAQSVSLARVWRLVRRDDTAVVVSVGGYASVPAVLAAWIRRVPVVAVSYDAHAGLASRLAGRLAAANAVAFAASALPRASVTGAPVRAALLRVDRAAGRAEARTRLGVGQDRFLVFVVGGSLGSERLNAAAKGFVDAHNARRDLAVRHVVGERNLDHAPAGRSGDDGIVHQVIGFDEHVDDALCAADLVIARAGASTVAELAALAIPSVLVPWPGAAGDHQRGNAEWLGSCGAAIVIDDVEWTADKMVEVVGSLLDGQERLHAMADAARALDARHGAERIAALIEDHARP